MLMLRWWWSMAAFRWAAIHIRNANVKFKWAKATAQQNTHAHFRKCMCSCTHAGKLSSLMSFGPLRKCICIFFATSSLSQCHFCPCLCKIKSLNSIAWCRCVCVCVCLYSCPKTVPSAAYRFSRKVSHIKMWVTCVFVGLHKAFVVSDMPASHM